MKRYTVAIVFALFLSVFGIYSQVLAQNLRTELMEYFYPSGEFSYVNDEEYSATIYVRDGDVLKETHMIVNNGEIMPTSVTKHKLSIESITDETRLAIVSRQQGSRNIIMGDSYSEDKIFLFVRPSDTSMTIWVETVNGEKKLCTAHFTDISFWRKGEKLYRKAVKINKIMYLENGGQVVEWSYWVKGLSRLATYGYWGDPNQTTCIERSLKIDNKPIIEVSKK